MISILLAVYNGEKYVEESIKSIINQTYKDWECIVAFNGTIDSSKEIINKYTGDTRIRVIDFGQDKGKAKTLNKILPLCKYDWVAIQDDDDVWLSKKLEQQIKFINEFDVIGTNCQYIDKDGNFAGMPTISPDHETIVSKSLNGENQIINTSAIFKKTHALRVEGWDESIDGIEDYDFWLKLIKHNRKFINILKPLVLHRLHSNSSFNTKQYDLVSLLKRYQ